MELEEVRALIQELLSLMEENDLSEIEVDSAGVKVRLKKSSPAEVQVVTGTSQRAITLPAVPEVADSTAEEKGLVEIKSPMVGTFYQATAPDADPFVEKGSTVEPETTVCIIEAMKVMNEIKAEIEGKIVDILAASGEAVEFGQVLFLVEPPE